MQGETCVTALEQFWRGVFQSLIHLFVGLQGSVHARCVWKASICLLQSGLLSEVYIVHRKCLAGLLMAYRRHGIFQRLATIIVPETSHQQQPQEK